MLLQPHVSSSHRQLICQLRAREKEIYNLQEGRGGQFEDARTSELKEILGQKSEELDLRVRCLNDLKMTSQTERAAIIEGDRRSELR